MTASLTPPTPLNNTHSPVPPFPSSPAGSNFVPRREFEPQPAHHASSFALLAFSSNNVIRLSNFPPQVVNDLRTRLGNIIGLHSFRENAEHKLCELVLTGKPWSNNRSLSTEVILVQVFFIILTHGYSILSQLFYGKEHNDRLTFAFAKSDLPSIAPLPVPFALSFTSSTSLRVVCSPLHATPAILQSVRGAWPRGVVSEKKVGEHCYEFKLKGYSWFQEDTFAEDALTHMLTLLGSLDKHGWTFMTSVALSSSHSRNKDLWIFSGPSSAVPSQHIGRPMTPVNLGSPLKPSVHEPIIDTAREASGDSDDYKTDSMHHARSATETHINFTRHSPTQDNVQAHHTRSASDAPAVLRKKGTPRQAAESYVVNNDQYVEDGVPELLVANEEVSSPEAEISSGQQSPHTPLSEPPRHTLLSLPEGVDQHQEDDDDTRSRKELKDTSEEPESLNINIFTPPIGETPTPPLLGPTAFRPTSGSERNSLYNETARQSFDVPLAWIPGDQRTELENDTNAISENDEKTGNALRRLSASAFPEAVDDNRQSMITTATETTGPLPPGAWLGTPSIEAPDPIVEEPYDHDVTPGRGTPSLEPRQSTIISHSPHIVHPDLPINDKTHPSGPRRKSETGIVGVVSDTTPLTEADNVQIPPTESGQGNAPGKLESWVVVDPKPATSQPSSSTSRITAEAPFGQTEEKQVDGPAPESAPSATVLRFRDEAARPSTDDKSRPSSPNSRATTPSKSEDSPSRGGRSMLGRFLSRRGSRKGKGKSPNSDEGSDKEKGGKLKKSNSVLPTIKSGKRVSVD